MTPATGSTRLANALLAVLLAAASGSCTDQSDQDRQSDEPAGEEATDDEGAAEDPAGAEAGDERAEAGDERAEAGDGRAEAGDERAEAGDERAEAGDERAEADGDETDNEKVAGVLAQAPIPGTEEVDPDEGAPRVSEAQFAERFARCEQAKMHAGPTGITYEHRILGPRGEGCAVRQVFLTNPNPDWQGKPMTCVLDTSQPYDKALHRAMASLGDGAPCTGPLVDLMGDAEFVPPD